MVAKRRFYLGVAKLPYSGIELDAVAPIDGVEEEERAYLYATSVRLGEMLAQAIDRYQIEAVQIERVRRAIEQGTVLLYAQPIQMVQGVGRGQDSFTKEVLLRLSERGKIISAGAFIGDLSSHPNILQHLDRYVIAAAIERMSGTDDRVALNVSGASLSQIGFAEWLDRLLGRYKVEPDRLSLEITEQVQLSPATAYLTIEMLHRLKVRLGLDDFGTGFSSDCYFLKLCKYLKFLKLNGDAIRQLGSNPCARSTVASYFQRAADLNLDAIAECVETPEILGQVQAIAQAYPSVTVGVQGWHVGEVEPWI